MPGDDAGAAAHAKRVVLRVEDDLVLVHPPRAPRFRPLRGAELVRVGSVVDTRRVKLTSVVNPSVKRVQTIAVNGGIFRVAQAARRNAPTDIQMRILNGHPVPPCPRGSGGAARPRLAHPRASGRQRPRTLPRRWKTQQVGVEGHELANGGALRRHPDPRHHRRRRGHRSAQEQDRHRSRRPQVPRASAPRAVKRA